jgi:hypothetical protein
MKEMFLFIGPNIIRWTTGRVKRKLMTTVNVVQTYKDKKMVKVPVHAVKAYREEQRCSFTDSYPPH